MTLHIALCDDDNCALKDELALINDVLKEKEVNGIIDAFTGPQELLESNTEYNLIFLDIKMDGMNGIKVAEKIRKNNKGCLIFFVTNYEMYLDDAFDQHAFRFWTKPIDRHRLISGIDSAIHMLRKEKQFIDITVNSQKAQVSIENIIYLFIQNKRMHIITTKGEIISHDTYNSVFEQLNDYDFFFEPFRGYCVNFNYIKNYVKDKIYCSYKTKVYEIYLSRRKREDFLKNFIKWIGDE